ncbi:MAG TPA: MFS transporter [Pseudonocardiaceae bacterium]|nr:MFS transporter [Pseudonocardiaceae bacterium]
MAERTSIRVATGAHPARRHLPGVLAVIGLAQLLVVVDTTIVNIALPSARQELGMSETAAQWTLTAYTLAFGGLLLLGGRLADRWGRRKALITGALGFAFASCLGGTAGDAAVLIGARAAQGVCAALLAPATLSILAVTFTEPAARVRAYSALSAIAMSGSAVGLLAGGALAQFLDWRWCLLVNLPPAVVTAVGARVWLPAMAGERRSRLDWTGAAIGGGGIAVLAYALSGATDSGAAVRISLIAVGVVLLTVFGIRQHVVRNPLLPLSIIADRARGAACLSIVATGFGMFGMFLFLTFQLQDVLHFRPLVTGLAFLPFVVANAVAATWLTRRLLPHVGVRSLLAGGMVLLAVGLALLTGLGGSTPYWTLIAPAEVVLGVGAGLSVPSAINRATAGVRPHHSGIAAAVATTSQQVGASLGTAALNAIAVSSAGTAAVRGYGVASGWAAAVVAGTAVAVAVLAGRSPQPQ